MLVPDIIVFCLVGRVGRALTNAIGQPYALERFSRIGLVYARILQN